MNTFGILTICDFVYIVFVIAFNIVYRRNLIGADNVPYYKGFLRYKGLQNVLLLIVCVVITYLNCNAFGSFFVFPIFFIVSIIYTVILFMPINIIISAVYFLIFKKYIKMTNNFCAYWLTATIPFIDIIILIYT